MYANLVYKTSNSYECTKFDSIQSIILRFGTVVVGVAVAVHLATVHLNFLFSVENHGAHRTGMNISIQL